MNILIVDNESTIRETLTQLIYSLGQDSLKIAASDGVNSTLELLKDYTPDVVFLDVELDDGTGMDLLSRIENIPFHVIFITAHNKYAVDAFRFCAIDFLLKPIDPDALQIAMQKVQQQVKRQEVEKQLATLKEYFNETRNADKKIVLKDNDFIYIVRAGDIIRCEANGCYTTFFTTKGEKIVISKTLKEYADLLEPNGFLRTHQSHLVNTSFIKRFDKSDGGFLILENEHTVPVSQRKRDVVFELFRNL